MYPLTLCNKKHLFEGLWLSGLLQLAAMSVYLRSVAQEQTGALCGGRIAVSLGLICLCNVAFGIFLYAYIFRCRRVVFGKRQPETSTVRRGVIFRLSRMDCGVLLITAAVLAGSVIIWPRMQTDSALTCLEHGSVEELDALLFGKPELIEEQAPGGKTLLMCASLFGRSDMVDCILLHGGAVNAADASGDTALSFAVDRPDIVAALLEAGADPNQADRQGITPLHRAIQQRCVNSCILLLEYGADPDLENRSGETPFHWTARADFVPAAECLILAGADPVKSDSRGRTPLKVAALNGSVNVAALLKKAGAEEGNSTPGRENPLSGISARESRFAVCAE